MNNDSTRLRAQRRRFSRLAAVFAITGGVLVAFASPAEAATKKFTGISKPVIHGVKVVGQRLIAKPDTDTSPKASKITYQWLRGGRAIPKATKASYALTAADKGKKISVKVCYARAKYAKKCVTSAATSAVGKAIHQVAKPAISGVPAVGWTLTATPDKTTTLATTRHTYHWLRDGKPIPGTTNHKYQLTQADAGSRISVAVCHQDDGYSDRCATSGQMLANPAPPPIKGGTAGQRATVADLYAKYGQFANISEVHFTTLPNAQWAGVASPEMVWVTDERTGERTGYGECSTYIRLRPDLAGEALRFVAIHELVHASQNTLWKCDGATREADLRKIMTLDGVKVPLTARPASEHQADCGAKAIVKPAHLALPYGGTCNAREQAAALAVLAGEFPAGISPRG